MSLPPGINSVKRYSFQLGGNIPGTSIVDDIPRNPAYNIFVYELEGNNLPLVGSPQTPDTINSLLLDFYNRVENQELFPFQVEYANYWGQAIYDFLSLTGIVPDIPFFVEDVNELVTLQNTRVLHIKPSFIYKYLNLNHYDKVYNPETGWTENAILTGLVGKEYLTTETENGFTILVPTIGIEDKINNIGFTTEPTYGDLFSQYKSTIVSYPEADMAINICPKKKKKCCQCKKFHARKKSESTSAAVLTSMVTGIINASNSIVQKIVSFGEGKKIIQDTVNDYNKFLADDNYMIGIFNKKNGFLFVFCGRYKLLKNDALVAFSLSEDPEIGIIMSVSSVPMQNNMNDAVFPTRQPLTYISEKVFN